MTNPGWPWLRPFLWRAIDLAGEDRRSNGIVVMFTVLKGPILLGHVAAKAATNACEARDVI